MTAFFVIVKTEHLFLKSATAVVQYFRWLEFYLPLGPQFLKNVLKKWTLTKLNLASFGVVVIKKSKKHWKSEFVLILKSIF